VTQPDDAHAWALIQELQQVEGQKTRREIMTWSMLESFPRDLREATVAAAVPHWFDASILAALLPARADDAEGLYRELQRQPFVEPYTGRGHTLHELTREAILARLWCDDTDGFRALSERVRRYLAEREEHDPTIQIEVLYHTLVTNEGAALDALTGLHDEFRNVGARYHLAEALLRAAAEQSKAGHLSQHGRLYIRMEQAVLAVQRSEWDRAIPWLEEVLDKAEDRWLPARAMQYLGDVHVMLAEYEAARARYEEALPIYQAIGARLGEANTIKSLGDVHVRLAEYEAARARYEEALPIYQAIGARLGEANTIRSLGDVHVMLDEYEAARARYEEALPIYQAIGARLGEANTISSLGDLDIETERYATAEAIYVKAEQIYRTLETPANVASVLNSKANLFDQMGDYDRAVQTYGQAIALRPDFAMWYRNRASTHLAYGNVAAARIDLEQAAELQPDHPYLTVRRAELALLEGDEELAIRLCERAQTLLPGISSPYFTKGLALLQVERPVEARAAFEQGIERADRSDLSSAIRWVERHGPGGVMQVEILALLHEAVEAKRARYG
jgi:tetratricopeptide (TPR) repeat protein